MSEKSSSNLDGLNQMMTHGVIAVLLTLGAFGLYYSLEEQRNKPAVEKPPQVNNRPQLQPFPSFKKAEFDKVIREIQQQDLNGPNQGNPQFRSSGSIIAK